MKMYYCQMTIRNEFVNEYTYDPILWDVNIWPGPINDLNTCTMVRGNYLEKQDCKSTLPCGLCTLKSQKRLKLKGLCVDDLKEDADFDIEFYAYGLFNGRLHFRYYGHITRIDRGIMLNFHLFHRYI